MAATMMISGRPGITRNTLVRAESASLFHPDRYPAMTPTVIAMSVAMIAARNPTTITPRVPWMTWLSTSSPMCVVPSQCAADGGCRRAVLSTLVGEYGASTSAKIATSTKKPRMMSPAIDLPLRNMANAPTSFDQKFFSRPSAPGPLVRRSSVSGAPALLRREDVVVMAQLSVWRVRGSRNA
jgi:hypothetical protein